MLQRDAKKKFHITEKNLVKIVVLQAQRVELRIKRVKSVKEEVLFNTYKEIQFSVRFPKRRVMLVTEQER